MSLLGLDQTCTVYRPDPITGEFTVVDATLPRCRLALRGVAGAPTGPARAEAAAERHFQWPPPYEMPAGAAQLEVGADGRRWNVVEGTQGDVRAPSGTVDRRRCLVVEAK